MIEPSRSNRSFCALLFLGSLFLTLNLGVGYGQTTTASLSGIVTDASGAAIPDAVITASHAGTTAATKTSSDPSGRYVFPALPPGLYNLSVEKTGFKSSQLAGIRLLVDQKATLDIQLEVGEITTKIEVSAAAPQVESTTASVGTCDWKPGGRRATLEHSSLWSLGHTGPGDDNG